MLKEIRQLGKGLSSHAEITTVNICNSHGERGNHKGRFDISQKIFWCVKLLLKVNE